MSVSTEETWRVQVGHREKQFTRETVRLDPTGERAPVLVTGLVYTQEDYWELEEGAYYAKVRTAHATGRRVIFEFVGRLAFERRVAPFLGPEG